MVQTVKNIKQRLPQLKINIGLGLQLAVFGLIYVHSGSITAVLGIFLFCKLIGLVLRLLQQILSLIFTGFAILIFIVIISLLII